MIDALCHLELFASVADAGRALDAAAAAGVTHVVSAGTDPLMPELAPTGDSTGKLKVLRAFGIHPENVRGVPEELRALEKKLDGDDVVAVGECGLDARDGTPPMEMQEQVFRAQVAIARRRRLPLIVHGVRCPARILAIMQEPSAPWIWHGFADSLETAKLAVAAGAVISVGALVLNPRARKVREAVEGVGSAVLVETDAPDVDLTTLKEIVITVGVLQGVPARAMAELSAALARRIFGIGAAPSERR